ncbi:MAG: sulfite exporter TauE/SafE family protein [Hyphomicrobiaceae bacterium]
MSSIVSSYYGFARAALPYTGGLMHIAVSTQGLVMLGLALIAAGFVMGFLAGLFGIGGGAILVPALYEAFGAIGVDRSIIMHLCLGTALAVMIPTTITSFRGHAAKGAVDVSFLKRVGPWIVGGVLIGAVIARFVDSLTLQWTWAFLGGGLALKMALGRDDWRIAETLPEHSFVPEIVSLFIGLISTLMSVGGASFMITFLSLYGWQILPSVATSSGLGPLIAIPGTLGFMWAGWGTSGLPALSIGYVSLIGAALVIPASVVAAPVGVRLAHGMPKRKLELAFALFLAIMSARFFWSAVTGG